MQLTLLKPKKALNKAYLKVKPIRSDMELFKKNLIDLLDNSNDTESEEFHKNLVADFLKRTYYEPNYFINTKGRNDLVIHTGSKAKDPVGVILEAKKPTNRNEMVSESKPNTKALQELVLYYLRERITSKNLEVKNLIITNIYEWYIFDASDFEDYFAQNKTLVKQFQDFENGSLSGTTTDFFYKEIAAPAIEAIKDEFACTYFDIREFEKPLRNDDRKDDIKLIALFKLLSPEHVLKKPFTNDSNSLDKRFYSELLHIIGLTETKEGGKKVIERNKSGERNTGSFLEDAIIQLDSLDKIGRMDKPSQFGATSDERLFNVGLELSITWVNRILFLKLLEAQLITYHGGDKKYSFLNFERISSYDDLNSLFFQVLAKKYEDRNEDVKKAFENVPYLNSSLFEPTEIEHSTLLISNLRDDKALPILNKTVLKDAKGKTRTGELSTLEYLFEFLNAYDFSGEGAENIQEDNKTLINASVLGLIFEKINGYKDGSFFTPGFITMYMCRETIRKAVVQKFNEAPEGMLSNLTKGEASRKVTSDDKYTSIDDIYNAIGTRGDFSHEKANELINDVKICDPAVGSGHFLVSALNEMIAVKHDLGVLHDRNGRLLRDYNLEVVNDELIVTDVNGELFEYNFNNKESQRLQETLFHEKQTTIENSLFGVDINPNSVKICRLRLWVELLKNAYYKNETELETLPNIDINIKCGNSLISRFDLDADLSKALRKSKWNMDGYRLAVHTYRNAESKEQKHEMERLIADIKGDFETNIETPFKGKLSRARGKVDKIATEINTKKQWEELISKKLHSDLKKATNALKKREQERDEIATNKIYENAFEWRFEFPEILDDDGSYLGFDVVIGNPPYIRVQELPYEAIDFYKQKFQIAYKRIDISILFSELGFKLLNKNGYLTYITSNQFLKAEYGRKARKFLIGKLFENIDYSKVSIFDGLATYVSVISITKNIFTSVKYKAMDYPKQKPENLIEFENSTLGEDSWDFNVNQDLIKKLYSEHLTLDSIANFTYGVITGFDGAFLIPIEKVNSLNLEKEITKNFIRPQNYKKYLYLNQTYSLIYPYQENNQILDENTLQNNYPNCYNFLKDHKEKLEDRKDSRVTIKEKGIPWYSIMRRVNLEDINCKKIVFYDVGMEPNFLLDEHHNIFGGGTSHSLRIVDENYSIKYVLGLLNSSLIKWIIYDICPVKMGGARKYGLNYIKKLPIPLGSFEIQENISHLVDTVVENKKKALNTKNIERQIDQIVYTIYGLTEEEIKIVEES